MHLLKSTLLSEWLDSLDGPKIKTKQKPEYYTNNYDVLKKKGFINSTTKLQREKF